MSRPPHAREKVLDAFEHILGTDGERAATLEAVARAAGVSKGGLLYHFASKEALEAALIERSEALLDHDVERILHSPEGPIAYFLRSSILPDTPLEESLIALARLAQAGSDAAKAQLGHVRERWAEALRPFTRDETALTLVMLVSDGLYYNNVVGTQSVPGQQTSEAALRALIALVAETGGR